MSNPHTPGRLSAFTLYAEPELRDEAGNLVAVVHRYSNANARRLAACWNACADISTYALENGPTPTQAFTREQERADTAERERDELLAALQAIKAEAGNPERVYQLTSAALTKHQPIPATTTRTCSTCGSDWLLCECCPF